jgi:maleate isomerase
VGLLVPSSNSTQEPEFAATLPSSVSLHVTRLGLASVDPDSTLKIVAELEKEAKKLADADVDVILLAATAPSTRMGKGYDAQIIQRIHDATGRRATTAATAMIAAMHAYRARRIALAGPWSSQTNQQVTDFLVSHGFEVLSQEAAEVTRNNDIGRLAPETAIELGLKADRPEADVLFLACGNWWTMPIIEELEARVKKPVLTTNNVAIWQVLQMLGGHATVPGFGRLLREMPAIPVVPVEKAA